MNRARFTLAVWLAGTGAMLAFAASSQAATPEAFAGAITSQSVVCNASNQLSGSFTASGTAAGQQPGTFTETGTFYPYTAPDGSSWTALSASFRAPGFNGTKDLVGRAGCSQGLDTVGFSFSASGGYFVQTPPSPLCPRGGAQVGTTTVTVNSFQVVGGPESGTLNETFNPLASTC